MSFLSSSLVRTSPAVSGAPLTATVAALCCAALLSLPLAAQVDPFYLGALQDGERSIESENYVEAISDLRIACFGLLEQPPLLAKGLVLLAIAQANAGDNVGFRTTFSKLIEVESRFRGYSQSSLDAAQRQEFETEVLAQLPPDLLASAEGFAHLQARREKAELQSLPPKKRLKALEARAEEEPETATWQLELAQASLTRGEYAKAVGYASRALDLEPTETGFCLRGLGHFYLERYQEATEDLQRCSRARREETFATAYVTALLELGRVPEALGTLETLPAEVASAGTLQQLARRAEASRGDTPTPLRAPVESPDATLARARALAESASSTAELDQALAMARGVADQNPRNSAAQHLVGEIAYRASRWNDVVTYITRGGDPGKSHPQLLFYLAVASYETGNLDLAASSLRRCLDDLRRTAYVNSYVEKILGNS